MCGRVIQSSGPLRYAIVDGMNVPRWNAAPSQELLIIRRNHKTDEVSLDPLRWGLIPIGAMSVSGALLRRKSFLEHCEVDPGLQISRQPDHICDGLASYRDTRLHILRCLSNNRKERTQLCQIPSRATGPNRRLWRSRTGGSSKIRCNKADTARSFPRVQHATASRSSRRSFR